MGRPRKYKTEKERREAQLRWQREHYYRNRDRILKKARQKYKEKKKQMFDVTNIYGER